MPFQNGQYVLSGLAEIFPPMNKRFQRLLELDALQRQRETGISLHHICKEFLQRLTPHHDGADLDLPASTVTFDVSYQQCVLVRLEFSAGSTRSSGSFSVHDVLGISMGYSSLSACGLWPAAAWMCHPVRRDNSQASVSQAGSAQILFVYVEVSIIIAMPGGCTVLAHVWPGSGWITFSQQGRFVNRDVDSKGIPRSIVDRQTPSAAEDLQFANP